MLLEKVVIKNYKSIQEIEINVQKFGNSYTNLLLGINEVGKSNILRAMSYLNVPDAEVNYDLLHNQKDEISEFIDINFHFNIKDINLFANAVRSTLVNGDKLIFNITNLEKNVFLEKGDNQFRYQYNYNVEIKDKLYIGWNRDELLEVDEYSALLENSEELDEDKFIEFFGESLERIFDEEIPNVSFWKPSDEYLISSIDLNSFKDDIDSNIPLKNIFALAGYVDEEKIVEQINKIEKNQFRQKLMKTLSKKTTEYIKSIWKHNVEIYIEITDSYICNVSVKDDGEENEFNYFEMNARSEGFKQFISLILSLSIETKKLNRRNRLILIDEPETHLHPSGIRDLGRELLSIGEQSFLFIATHSPFLIDKNNKERHLIIQKDKEANTIKKEIKDYEDLRDDEVLREAFGLNIYRDLLNSKRLLLEGASDKIILQKAFRVYGHEFGITNGNGSNIVQVASKLNDDDIDVLVITDSDKEGQLYKDEIVKISGVFNNQNVFTLNDLVSESIKEGTIEDFLGKEFVLSQTKKLYKEIFSEDCNFALDDNSSFLEQIKIQFFKEKKIDKERIDTFLKELKINLSNEIKFTKGKFNENFPLLKKLIDAIKERL